MARTPISCLAIGDTCPECGRGKVTARTNKLQGTQFLGCTRFPDCRWHAPLADPEVPPMLPERPVDCPNPLAAAMATAPLLSPRKVQQCFRTLVQLMLCEGCQDRKVSEVKSRLLAQFGQATLESLRLASRKPVDVQQAASAACEAEALNDINRAYLSKLDKLDEK